MMLDCVSEGMEGKRMALDLEWKTFSKIGDDQKALLFQIEANERAVIFHYIEQDEFGEQHKVLKYFLISHTFVGKSIFSDLTKLREQFNVDFSTILYDFEYMYMRKYDKCASFICMIEIYT